MIRHRVLAVKNINSQNFSCNSVNSSMLKQNFVSTEKQSFNCSLVGNNSISKSTPKHPPNQILNRVVMPRKQFRNNSTNHQTSNLKSHILCEDFQTKLKSRTYAKIHKYDTKTQQRASNKVKQQQEQEVYSKGKQLQQIKWLEKMVDSFEKYEMQLNGQQNEQNPSSKKQLFQNASNEKGKSCNQYFDQNQVKIKPRYDNIKIVQRKCIKKESKQQDQKNVCKRLNNKNTAISTNKEYSQNKLQRNTELQATKKNSKSSKQNQFHKSIGKWSKPVQNKSTKTIHDKNINKPNNTTILRNVGVQQNNRCSESLQDVSAIEKSLQIQLITQNKPKSVTYKRQCNSQVNDKNRQAINKIQIANNPNKGQAKKPEIEKKYLIVKDYIPINFKINQKIQQKQIVNQKENYLKAKSVGKIKKNKPQIINKKRVVTECQKTEQQDEQKSKYYQKQQIHQTKEKHNKYNYFANLNQNDQLLNITSNHSTNKLQNQCKIEQYYDSLQKKKHQSIQNYSNNQNNSSFAYIPCSFPSERNSYSLQKAHGKSRKLSDFKNRTCKFANEQRFSSIPLNKQQKIDNLSINLDDRLIRRYPIQGLENDLSMQMNKRQRTISDVEIEQILQRTNTLKGQLNRLTCQYKKDKLFLHSNEIKNPISYLRQNLLSQANRKDWNNCQTYKRKRISNEISQAARVNSSQNYNSYRRRQCRIIQMFNKLDNDGSQILSRNNCNAEALDQNERVKLIPLLDLILFTNKKVSLAKFVKECDCLDWQINFNRKQIDYSNKMQLSKKSIQAGFTDKSIQAAKPQKNIKIQNFTQQCIQPIISPQFNQQLKHTISLQPSKISNFQHSKNQSIVQEKYSVEGKSVQMDPNFYKKSIDQHSNIKQSQNSRFLNSLNSISSNKYSKSTNNKDHDFKKKDYRAECNAWIPGFSGVLKQVQVTNKQLNQQKRRLNLYAQQDQINKIEILNQKLERYINKISSSKELRTQELISYRF